MDLKDMLAVRPETLAREQEVALATFAAERLRHIADLIEAGDYSQAFKLISHSPAGDDMGADNYYIDFADETGLEDIGAVLTRLAELSKKGTSK